MHPSCLVDPSQHVSGIHQGSTKTLLFVSPIALFALSAFSVLRVGTAKGCYLYCYLLSSPDLSVIYLFEFIAFLVCLLV